MNRHIMHPPYFSHIYTAHTQTPANAAVQSLLAPVLTILHIDYHLPANALAKPPRGREASLINAASAKVPRDEVPVITSSGYVRYAQPSTPKTPLIQAMILGNRPGHPVPPSMGRLAPQVAGRIPPTPFPRLKCRHLDVRKNSLDHCASIDA